MSTPPRKLLIVRAKPLGFPERLQDKIVEVEPHGGPDAGVWQLTAKRDRYMRLSDRSIKQGHAEWVLSAQDQQAALYAAMYQQMFGAPLPGSPPVGPGAAPGSGVPVSPPSPSSSPGAPIGGSSGGVSGSPSTGAADPVDDDEAEDDLADVLDVFGYPIALPPINYKRGQTDTLPAKRGQPIRLPRIYESLQRPYRAPHFEKEQAQQYIDSIARYQQGRELARQVAEADAQQARAARLIPGKQVHVSWDVAKHPDEHFVMIVHPGSGSGSGCSVRKVRPGCWEIEEL